MCNGYFNHDSDCLATFTGKKLRQWPPHAGVASLAECEPNETVEATTRRFMKAVGYQGLVGIGYRYDARDGLYKVLDVNPRVSGVFRLFVAADGMDIARVAYLGLTHQPVPPIAAPPGAKVDDGRGFCFRVSIFATREIELQAVARIAAWSSRVAMAVA